MSFDLGQMVTCDHVDRYGNVYTGVNIVLCPKCAGAGEYYDMTWNLSNGNPQPVEDLALLEELSVKAVLTIKGEDAFNPTYGTSIITSVGTPLSSMQAVTRLIEQEVTDALASLRARQNQQRAVGQYMSKDEVIYSVSQLNVTLIDSRTLRVIMDIVAESGNTVTIKPTV